MRVTVTDAKIVGTIGTPNRREDFGTFDPEGALPQGDFFSHVHVLPPHDRFSFLRLALRLKLERKDASGICNLLTSYSFLAAYLIENEDRIGAMSELLGNFAGARELLGPKAGGMGRIQSALELGRAVLETNPGQLAEQLFGRLADDESPEARRLLDGALQSRTVPWLRPLTASLCEPSGSLRRALLVPPGRPGRLAVHPDGFRCVAAIDGGLVIWDFEQTEGRVPEGGEMTFAPVADLTDVTDLLVTRDGSLAVVAQRGGEIRGWSLSPLQEVFSTRGPHNGAVLALLEMPGGILLSGGTAGSIQAWQLPQGTWLRTVCEPGDSISALVALPGERSFASAGDLVRIWDLDSGVDLHTFERTDWPEVQAAALSSDGRGLLGAVNNDFAVWDLERREKLFQVAGQDTRRIHVVTAMPERPLALIGNGDGGLVVRSLEDGSEVYRVQAHQGALADLALTPDGHHLLTASWDQTIKLWNLGSLPPAQREAGGHKDSVHALMLLPGRTWALSGGDDGALIFWSLETRLPLRHLRGHRKWLRALAVSEDGSRAVSASWDGTVKVWDVDRGETTLDLAIPKIPGEIHFESVAISPAARQIAAGTYDGTLIAWDLENPTSPRVIPGAHRSSITGLSFLSDGVQLVSISQDGSLKSWDDHGNLLRILGQETPPTEPVLSSGETAWSPDCPGLTGLTLLTEPLRALTASSKGDLALWNLETGSQIGCWPVTSFGLTGLSVSADGRLAALASGTPTSTGESSLRIWDLVAGRLVAHFIGETPMMSCALSADGRLALAGDEAGQIHFLYLERPGPAS